jgi:hypothetical protein
VSIGATLVNGKTKANVSICYHVSKWIFFFFFYLKTRANVCIVGTLVNVKNFLTCLYTTTLVNGIFYFIFYFPICLHVNSNSLVNANVLHV